MDRIGRSKLPSPISNAQWIAACQIRLGEKLDRYVAGKEMTKPDLELVGYFLRVIGPLPIMEEDEL